MKTFRNLDKITTAKLKEILDNPFCVGVDGADYHPVKDYLQEIYWARLNAESEKLEALRERQFREQFKAMAKRHKKPAQKEHTKVATPRKRKTA